MSKLPPAAVMIIENEELLRLLPHKNKMLLISRVTEYDIHQRFLCSEYDVSENCMFYDPVLGGVPVWMSFEFMAQAVSALAGLTGYINGKPPMIGFIMSVSSFEIKKSLITNGEIVQVKITEESKLDMVANFNCSVFIKGTNTNDTSAEISTARLMLIDVEDPLKFIKKD